MNSDKNQKDLVSIVMPAYNCEKYIGEAISSVIDQTYKDWELLVIDDGSRDNTVHIVDELARNDSRIRLCRNENNQGVSAARNRGISLANGDWIAFLDSDDRWDQTKLEKQMRHALETSAAFVFTGSSFINEEGASYPGIFEVPPQVTYQKLRHHNVISCSSVLIRKRFFETIQMERDDLHEDYAVWLRVLQKGVTAHGINEPLLIYRLSRNSKSGNKIKTLKMTYKVFRFIGINPVGSAYFTLRHILGSIQKYKKLSRVEN